VTIFAQALTFVAQMASITILARVLMPADFGIVTMVTTFSVLLVSCGHIGFPDAVLQRDEIDRSLASNLFWMNVAVGLVLTAGFAGAGHALSKLYGDPRVGYIAPPIALSILFDSAAALHIALLKRAMCFAAVSANDILARIGSVLVSVTLGLSGFGYWALVAGVVASPFFFCVGAWSRCRWIPSLPRRRAGTRSMLRFAVQVYGRFSLGYVTQNIDNLLVGWRFGPTVLGFYKKAYDLFVLPFNLLTVYSVAVSTLSRLNADRAEYKRYLLGGLSVLALVGMAVAGTLTVVGKDVVRALLGPRWETAGDIFVFFGPGIGAMLIYSTHGMIHLSIGTTGRFLRWGLCEFTVTLALFALALRWGARGIAGAWTVSYWLLIVPAFWYAGKPIGLKVTEVLGAVWKCMLASLLAGGGCYGIERSIPALSLTPSDSVHAIVRTVVMSSLFVLLYSAAVALLHGGGAPFRPLWRIILDFLPRRIVSKLSIPTETGALTPSASQASGTN